MAGRPKKTRTRTNKPSLRTLRFRDRAPSSPCGARQSRRKIRVLLRRHRDSQRNSESRRRNRSTQGWRRTPRLRALTLSPAEIFGVSDRLGSIENGKIANLVVTDGDLFDEKTKIKIIFVDGQRFEAHEPEKPKDAPKGNISGKWKLALHHARRPRGIHRGLRDGQRRHAFRHGDQQARHGQHHQRLSAARINSASRSTFPSREIATDVIFTGTFDGKALKGNIHVPARLDIDFTGTKPTSSRR